MKRWHAEVVYRSESGLVDVHHDIEELGDLEGLVERGPDWHTLERITVTLQRPAGTEFAGLTVEEAEKL